MSIYLGQSAVLDFAVCAGLGVAAVSCVMAAANLARENKRVLPTRAITAVVGILTFMLFGGSLLSIALMLGETKTSRDPDSILGFVTGALLASIVFYAAARRRN